MGPIVLLGLAGAGGLLLYLFTRPRQTEWQRLQQQQLEAVGTPVTGASGKRWTVILAKPPEGEFYTYNVLAMPREFGPHELMPVIQYRQTGTDENSRLFTLQHPGVPQIAVATAIQDFGVRTGPG